VGGSGRSCGGRRVATGLVVQVDDICIDCQHCSRIWKLRTLTKPPLGQCMRRVVAFGAGVCYVTVIFVDDWCVIRHNEIVNAIFAIFIIFLIRRSRVANTRLTRLTSFSTVLAIYNVIMGGDGGGGSGFSLSPHGPHASRWVLAPFKMAVVGYGFVICRLVAGAECGSHCRSFVIGWLCHR